MICVYHNMPRSRFTRFSGYVYNLELLLQNRIIIFLIVEKYTKKKKNLVPPS
jgi:hypothetical protein